jgi:hypothetical protein
MEGELGKERKGGFEVRVIGGRRRKGGRWKEMVLESVVEGLEQEEGLRWRARGE